MFKSPILIVLVVFAVVGVGVGVFSVRRRARVRNLCSRAAQAIQESRYDDATRILLVAEQSWAFSSHDGGRSSKLSDLEDLSRILMLLSQLPNCDSSRVAQAESVVSELRAFFTELSNFGIDGSSVKRDAAVRWLELSDRLGSVRSELRKSYIAA